MGRGLLASHVDSDSTPRRFDSYLPSVFNVDDVLDLTKHRDYAHDSFADHEFAHGARARVVAPVYCNVDPVTESELTPSELYFIVRVTLHTLKEYLYLIPAEADNSEPNVDTVKATMNAYARNPVEGGREPLDYIDEEETSEEALDLLAQRFTDRLING